MRRRISVVQRISTLLLLGAGSLLGGCGSSSHTGAGSGSRSSPNGPASVSTQPPITAASPSAPPASPPAGPAGGSRGTPAGGSRTARVPATFIVRRGGRLDPRFVSSPAFLAVQLTVVSGDGVAHRVVLRTPTAHHLSVPPGGRASILIEGLRAQRYDLEIDGVVRGGLEIGGEPGP